MSASEYSPAAILAFCAAMSANGIATTSRRRRMSGFLSRKSVLATARMSLMSDCTHTAFWPGTRTVLVQLGVQA